MEGSMKDEEGRSGRGASVPTRQGHPPQLQKAFDAIDRIKRENPDKNPSELARLSAPILKEFGIDLRVGEEDAASESIRIPCSNLPPAFHYPTFKEAYFDLGKRLPSYVTSSESFEKSYLGGRVTLENFLRFVNGFLEKIPLPFVLSTDDHSRLAFLEYGTSASLPPVMAQQRPVTHEVKEVRGAQASAAAEHLQNPPPEPDESLSEEVGIPELSEITTIVCIARTQLIALKAKHTVNPQEKEDLLNEGLAIYNNFLQSIDYYERVAVNTILNVKSDKARAFHHVQPIFGLLKDFYASQGKYKEYLDTCKKVRAFVNNASQDLEFIVKALKPKHKDFAQAKGTLLSSLSTLFDMSIQEARANQQIGNMELAADCIRDMGHHIQRYSLFVEDKKDERYREMRTVLADLKTLSSQKGVSRSILSALSEARLQAAISQIEGHQDNTVISRHEALFKSFQTKFRGKQISLVTLQGAAQDVYAFENYVLGRERTSPLTSDDALAFYSKYYEGIHHNAIDFYTVTKLLLTIFMSLGEYQEVLTHMDAFRKVFPAVHQGQLQSLENLEAICMAFLGNQGKLMEIVKASLVVQEEAAAVKLQREEQKTAILKRVIENRQKKAEQLEEEKKRTRDAQRTRTVVSPVSLAVSSSGDQLLQGTLDSAVERLAKEERHLARELQREQLAQEEHLAVPASALAAPTPEPMEEHIQEAAPSIPFEEFFSLTRLQKRIEREIQSNTWSFTEGELATYYESFACSIRQRGSHVTASMPSFNFVDLPNGEILMAQIDFEFGGSFTFANWESSVPFYLRPQILEARRKIQAYYTLLAQVESSSKYKGK